MIKQWFCFILLMSFCMYMELNIDMVLGETSDLTTSISPGAGKGELIDSEVKPATGSVGDLTIDANSSLSFGAIKIGESSKIAQVPPGEKLGIQIRDVRGTGEGWNLNVKISSFKNTQYPYQEVNAVIEFPKGTLKNGINDNFGRPVNAHTHVNQVFQPLLIAKQGHGMGQWLLLFENESNKVKLTNIPSGNLVGNYTADIEWQLTNAPS